MTPIDTKLYELFSDKTLSERMSIFELGYGSKADRITYKIFIYFGIFVVIPVFIFCEIPFYISLFSGNIPIYNLFSN